MVAFSRKDEEGRAQDLLSSVARGWRALRSRVSRQLLVQQRGRRAVTWIARMVAACCRCGRVDFTCSMQKCVATGSEGRLDEPEARCRAGVDCCVVVGSAVLSSRAGGTEGRSWEIFGSSSRGVARGPGSLFLGGCVTRLSC